MGPELSTKQENIIAVFEHSRRFADLEACFLLVTVVVFLFLFDKFRLKHLLKHADKKKIARIAAVYQKLVRQLCSDFSEHIVK